MDSDFVEKFRERIETAHQSQDITKERLFAICEDLLVALKAAYRTINMQIGHIEDWEVSCNNLRNKVLRLEIALGIRESTQKETHYVGRSNQNDAPP